MALVGGGAASGTAAGPTGIATTGTATAGTATTETPAAEARRSAAGAADARLHEELRALGFAGPRYEIFRAELAAYGRPVLRKWILTGEIYRRSRAERRPVPVEPHIRRLLRDDADAREQLAHDTVLAGLDLFHRHGMVGGRWNAEKGASLRTYFVRATVLVFKDTLLCWARSFAHLATEEFAEDGDGIDRWLSRIAGTADLQDEVVGADLVARYLATLDGTNRAIVELRLDGMTPTQIAERLSMSAERVRTRLHRLRTAFGQDLGEGDRW
ncbi:sigma factor-like helix-turn-helix DNA-binding protein [Kitasatospora purpeofusca]|uniref:sigma factor-like helix-turn-helix DNA-binding protein n=1 Tax=Kitasatospora purpeofusca TaxID=67352 RepID=UPI0033C6F8DC